jgi:flagellar biosynthetic protein FlhB
MGDADDRTIPATPRRRELARRQGGMPLAHQPAWAAAAATTVLLLPAWARATFPAATEMMRGALTAAVIDGGSAAPRAAPAVPLAMLVPTAAVIVAAGVVGLAVRLLLDGGGWRPSRVAPSLDRISLIAGLARIFSARTAVVVATSAAALATVTAVGILFVGPLVAVLGEPAAAAEPELLMPPMRRALVAVAAGSVVLAAGQWIMARLRFERRIRMTPQEYADEARSMQAAPQVRLMQRRAGATTAHPRPAAADSAAGLRSAAASR